MPGCSCVEDRPVLGIAHHAGLHADPEDVPGRERDVLAIGPAFADLGDVALQTDAEEVIEAGFVRLKLGGEDRPRAAGRWRQR